MIFKNIVKNVYLESRILSGEKTISLKNIQTLSSKDGAIDKN